MTNTIYSTKICSKCKKEKPLNHFNKDKQKVDGLRPECKVCRKRYYSNNKESIQEKSKSYYSNNRESIQVRLKSYHSDNKESIQTKSKLYYSNNKDSIQAKSKLYYSNNKESMKQVQKEWRFKNRDKLNQYMRNRNSKSLNNRVHKNISSGIRGCINKKQSTSKYLEMFGYSIEQLKSHLENQFIDGMTWDNYGEWHIDHIKPKSLFDCSDEKQLIECWSLSNLQPLWAIDNFIKNNRY